jgi:hypothetical protein
VKVYLKNRLKILALPLAILFWIVGWSLIWISDTEGLQQKEEKQSCEVTLV